MSPRLRRWLKILWLVVLVLALIALAVGCGEDAPDTGQVIDKRHTPDHYITDTYNQCYAYDKNGYCTFSAPVHSQRYVPARWEFKLERCEINDEGDNKCRSGWRNVSEVVYHDYDIGDYFPKEGKR